MLSAKRRLEVVAVSQISQLGATPPPDVLIIDAKIMMREISAARSNFGLSSSLKVLVLADSVDEDEFMTAFASGARGYLLKGANEIQLLEAVYALHRGEEYVSPSAAAAMLIRRSLERRGKGANAIRTEQLSYRESDIFNLLPTGLTNREIGERLGVTESTIKRYLTRIFDKLQVRNRVEAAMLSRRDQAANRVALAREPLAYRPPIDTGRRVNSITQRGSIAATLKNSAGGSPNAASMNGRSLRPALQRI